MSSPSPPSLQPEEAKLWAAWLVAADDPQVQAGLLEIFQATTEAIERRGPTCWLSGLCCKFDAYGHRLYVTGLETAWLLRQGPDFPPNPDDAVGGCPFQVAKLCKAHAIRPLGCRVFFCQQGTEEWQQALYEEQLAELRRLHERFDLPYRYMEWRLALSQGSRVMAQRSAEPGGSISGDSEKSGGQTPARTS
jgi:Fe-S-cluster containining protein